MTSFFALVEIILKLLRLRDEFLDYLVASRIKEEEEKRQNREKAIDAIEKAEDEDAFDKAQEEIVRNKPGRRPS
jgi:hypothetical protein